MIKQRILITGGKGMLASSLYDIINDKYETLSLSKEKLDITIANDVKKVINEFKPNIIFHSAALTNVDMCEEKSKMAFNINSDGTENIARYGSGVNAKVVYISSCGLFGDEIKAYSEDDKVVLKTKYSESKYKGEKSVEKYCEKYYIIRPGWLFGGSKIHKKNFVYNRYLEGQKNNIIISADDKYGCPTYVFDLAKKVLELLETNKYGIYHISNAGSASRYEYVKKIIESFNLNVKVKKCDSSFFKRSAPVPNCEIIENKNLRKNKFDLLPDWEDAIDRYIKKLKIKL
ncbi:SDR family oxidoreductase [Clostridium tyrobutyricum]|uniref:SDR family oxidoreductase n=1 Tax=Clostridium tyrobutyricum TaxID=1519 RepID=UPI00030BE8B9|nr:NAD(P)-dependent oxidoreductase [Clostridium tyrobutyricum]